MLFLHKIFKRWQRRVCDKLGTLRKMLYNSRQEFNRDVADTAIIKIGQQYRMKYRMKYQTLRAFLGKKNIRKIAVHLFYSHTYAYVSRQSVPCVRTAN